MAVLREPLLALFGRGYEAGARQPLVLARRSASSVLNAAGPLTALAVNLSGPPACDALRATSLVFSANLVLCVVLVPRYTAWPARRASTLIALCTA